MAGACVGPRSAKYSRSGSPGTLSQETLRPGANGDHANASLRRRAGSMRIRSMNSGWHSCGNARFCWRMRSGGRCGGKSTRRGVCHPTHLSPLVSGVWACGAYHSRGRGRGLPWSHLLREAKNPPSDEAQRRAILKLACGYLCRYILEVTGVLRHADVVVAVPPDPGRYVERAMSLPDEVAIAIEQQLALPRSPEALVKRKSVELRGLSWGDRRRMVAGSMAARDVKPVRGRCVLVVDDVMTSGATLSEAARVLRDAGARDVHGVVLCHTEG